MRANDTLKKCLNRDRTLQLTERRVACVDGEAQRHTVKPLCHTGGEAFSLFKTRRESADSQDYTGTPEVPGQGERRKEATSFALITANQQQVLVQYCHQLYRSINRQAVR